MVGDSILPVHSLCRDHITSVYECIHSYVGILLTSNKLTHSKSSALIFFRMGKMLQCREFSGCWRSEPQQALWGNLDLSQSHCCYNLCCSVKADQAQEGAQSGYGMQTTGLEVENHWSRGCIIDNDSCHCISFLN